MANLPARMNCAGGSKLRVDKWPFFLRGELAVCNGPADASAILTIERCDWVGRARLRRRAARDEPFNVGNARVGANAAYANDCRASLRFANLSSVAFWRFCSALRLARSAPAAAQAVALAVGVASTLQSAVISGARAAGRIGWKSACRARNSTLTRGRL